MRFERRDRRPIVVKIVRESKRRRVGKRFGSCTRAVRTVLRYAKKKSTSTKILLVPYDHLIDSGSSVRQLQSKGYKHARRRFVYVSRFPDCEHDGADTQAHTRGLSSRTPECSLTWSRANFTLGITPRPANKKKNDSQARRARNKGFQTKDLLKPRRSKRLLENTTRGRNNKPSTIGDGESQRIIARNKTSDNQQNDNSASDDDECSFDALTYKLQKLLRVDNLRNSEERILNEIRTEIDCIDNAIVNNIQETKMTSGSNKRKIEVDYEDLLKPIQLIPQSQWVYSTPDKQKIRKIVAQDTSKPQIMPAVYHTNKKMKVLYNLKEELVGKMNVDKFATGETVQIDKRFLRPICEVTLGESSNNQFLSSDSEHSIDIKDVNLTLSTTANETLKELEKEDDPAIAWVGGSHENDITIDFESNVYHVCTQRPAKTVKKSTRLNTFERRTLSFDETPKRTPNLVQKHKSDSILALSQGKMAFQDRSNLMIDPDQPSTSKSIVFRQQTPHPSLDEKDVENMCLISDNCASVVNSDCEFFGENLWPDMPELLSPKHLEMFPRKM